MASLTHHRITRRQTTNLGRSGPRSKTGCQTCKIRRVRCDERRPCCGHCTRLKLDCAYLPPRQRQSRRRQTTQTTDNEDDGDLSDGAGNQNDSDSGATLSIVAHVVDEPQHLPTITMESTTPNAGSAATTRSFLDPLADVTAESNTVPMDASASTMNGFSGVLTAGEASASCPPQAFEDYSAFPDPTFPFTSFAFTGSVDPSSTSARNIHPWPGCDTSSLGLFSGQSPGIHGWGDPTLTMQQAGSQASPASHQGIQQGTQNGSWPTFTVSPPLLSGSQEEALLHFFENDIRPPASLVGVDPLGWSHIRTHVLNMASEKRESVLHAIYALGALLSASSATIRLGTNREDHILFASRLHEATCAAIHLGVSHPGWETTSCQELLVAVFLLAWFEAAYDEDTITRPPFPVALAERVIVNGKQWDNKTSHVFQWLHMLDAKSSHLGGHHLLSEAALHEVRESRPTRVAADSIADAEDSTSLVRDGDRNQNDLCLSKSSSKVTGKKSSARRLSYLLSSNTQPTLPKRIIHMDLFNILLQPAFEFHMESQAYSRRVGCYDRHHRSRGTPEDEFEIMRACMAFEEELQELWKRRPGILSLNADQLKDSVSPDLAQRLEQLFSVYLATFWCHFVYIHRVAFWHMEHTPIVKKALQQVGNMMRRSVGQPMDQLEFDTSVVRNARNTVHPGLMWTCFLFGCEVGEPIQENWAVMQLGALGKLRNNRPSEGNSGEQMELLSMSLDEKGARNALKLSKLLHHLAERQTKLGTRVDGKYLCQELFGCYLYII